MAMVFKKKGLKRILGHMMSLGKKEVRYLVFLIVALTVLLLGKAFSMMEGDIGEQMVAMDRYNRSLRECPNGQCGVEQGKGAVAL
jgi:hypothetical protein